MDPERIKVPVPAFVKLVAAPLITPEIVKVPATVREAVAGIITGQDIVAVPAIVVIATPPFPTIVNVPPPALIDETPNMFAMVRHDPFKTSIVTVIPALIVISSALVGTAAPPQVAVLFQFPDTLAVLAAAHALFPPIRRIKIIPIITGIRP